LPDGNIMVSFRNISTVVMIDRRTGEIYWKLGAPPLSGQHAPTILANGHILLFDNGPHRLDQTFPFSRVLEIDPATKEIVWKYQETPVSNFFSPRISNAQRLPNGNTLINEGWFGRAPSKALSSVRSDCGITAARSSPCRSTYWARSRT
jgi:hypothetical protein